MYNNLNYYYQLTDPLHNTKSHTEQENLILGISSNLTTLDQDMDATKERLDEIERSLHSHADAHFYE